jgi:hypothetical protein
VVDFTLEHVQYEDEPSVTKEDMMNILQEELETGKLGNMSASEEFGFDVQITSKDILSFMSYHPSFYCKSQNISIPFISHFLRLQIRPKKMCFWSSCSSKIDAAMRLFFFVFFYFSSEIPDVEKRSETGRDRRALTRDTCFGCLGLRQLICVLFIPKILF